MEEPSVAAPVTEPPVESEADAHFTVLVRMTDGERIEAGSFVVQSEAHGFAEEFVAEIAGGDKRWPRVADRYLRPEAIVSVDVVRDEQPRWTGSTGRATSWTGRTSDS